MQILRNKAKLTATIVLVLLMTSFTLMAMPAQAQWYINSETYDMGWWGQNAKNLQPNGGQRLPAGVTPNVIKKVDPYLSFRPNPVGVGQTILVNMWTEPGPSFTRYFTDFKVTITKPDGTTDVKTLNSYRADSTAWFEYVVDQVGTWKLKFDFPGQYFPAGNYTTPPGVSNANYTESYSKSLYYTPASTAEQTLTVQSAMVASWPSVPLPTDYWTRPIPFENREWWTIAGNYPWRGPGGGSVWDELYPNTNYYWTANTGFFAGDNQRFTPWVQAPNTAHVAWKRMGWAISGILGGDKGTYGMTTGGGSPSIVYQGYAYQTVTKPLDGVTQSVLQCYNIRTGEVLWERIGVPNPTVIEYGEGLPSTVGAAASVGITPALVAISGNRLIKYTPATGAVSVNVSISEWATAAGYTTSIYYRNGYVLSVQQVNATGGPGPYGSPSAGIYRLINWTTFGTSSDFSSRIISNISWPYACFGDIIDPGAGIAFPCAEKSWFLTPVTGFPYAYVPYDNATGFRYGTHIQAISMKTGAVLWDKTVDNTIYHPSASMADHGKLVVLMRDDPSNQGGGYYMCFDEYTGNLLWKSEQMDYPWDLCAFGAYSVASAYGMFFRFGYSGIYAFDWDTGKIVWKYEANAPQYETPYTGTNGETVYSWNAGGWIADGKIYAYNTEHTPTQPITRGWGVHCINITTGELIWKTKMVGSIGAVADGYLTVSGTDGYMYVYGKGKSATTVTAPQTAVPQGTQVLIQGTVLDQSPAQPGTPCVSADSMRTQMEYLHRQQPIDGLWHNETISGVPVTLTAIGSDGTVIDIGKTTTNGYYGAFGMAWTPPKEDTYTIMASFAGDGSYGSSSAATFLSVGPAPASPTPTPEPPQAAPDNTPMYILGATIAIILAVAIVGIMLYRKRP